MAKICKSAIYKTKKKTYFVVAFLISDTNLYFRKGKINVFLIEIPIL